MILKSRIFIAFYLVVLLYSNLANARRILQETSLYGLNQSLFQEVVNIVNNPDNSMLIFDLDKTITDSSGKVPFKIINDILFLISKGVTVKIVTGSGIDSIREKLLEPIFKVCNKNFSDGEWSVLNNLMIYANIATEKFVFEESEKDFILDNSYGHEFHFSSVQLLKIREGFNEIKDRYQSIEWQDRFEQGSACLIEKDHKDIPDIDSIAEEILDVLGRDEFEVRVSGRFAIDVTKKNINKSMAVLDGLEEFDNVLAFGDSIANNSGDWFLFHPTDEITIPFVYVGYAEDVDISFTPDFYILSGYGSDSVSKVLDVFRIVPAERELINFLSKRDILSDEKKADLLLVLGSPDINVASCAAEIYKQGLASRILISGGGMIGDEREAIVFKRIMMEAGVPSDSILIEVESRDTDDNMINSIKLLEENSISPESIMLMQKPLAQMRSEAIYRKHFSDDIQLISHAPYIPDVTNMSETESLETMLYSLREIYRFFTLGPSGNDSIAEVQVPPHVLESSNVLLNHIKNNHEQIWQDKSWLDHLYHLIGQYRRNMGAIIEADDVIRADGTESKYDINGVAQSYKGITLVTGIESEAKKSLIEIVGRGAKDGLRGNREINSRVNFVSNASLHMTLADLVTSYKMYNNSEQEVGAKEEANLLKVLADAFQSFLDNNQWQDIDLTVSVNGIGMFPDGILFFSVDVNQEQFTVLEGLRGAVEKGLQKFTKETGRTTQSLYPDYITHITIGYLKPGVKVDSNSKKDVEFFKILRELNDDLRDAPISFTIRSGVVVPFDDMGTYGDNTFSSENDGSGILDEINLP